MPIKSLDEVHHLYKYRYFDNDNNHIKTISEYEFYFATQKELNDPFDLSSRICFDGTTKDEMIRYAKRKINGNNNFSKYEKEIKLGYEIYRINNNPNEFIKRLKISVDKQIKYLKICSFNTNNWANILMWSHYADNNKGFCVGLNWQKLSDFLNVLIEGYFGNIVPHIVNYQPKLVVYNPIKQDSIDYVENIFINKFDLWQYEDEIRLIMTHKTKNIIKLLEGIIDEVILGLKITPDNKKTIIDCLKLKSYKPKLYQIVQKEFSFEFDRVEIVY